MKRRHVLRVALGLIALLVCIIGGCSSGVRESSGRTAREGPLIRTPVPRPGLPAAAAVRTQDLPPPTREELWIIGREKQQAVASNTGGFDPGSGMLTAKAENET